MAIEFSGAAWYPFVLRLVSLRPTACRACARGTISGRSGEDAAPGQSPEPRATPAPRRIRYRTHRWPRRARRGACAAARSSTKAAWPRARPAGCSSPGRAVRQAGTAEGIPCPGTQRSPFAFGLCLVPERPEPADGRRLGHQAAMSLPRLRGPMETARRRARPLVSNVQLACRMRYSHGPLAGGSGPLGPTAHGRREGEAAAAAAAVVLCPAVGRANVPAQGCRGGQRRVAGRPRGQRSAGPVPGGGGSAGAAWAPALSLGSGSGSGPRPLGRRWVKRR